MGTLRARPHARDPMRCQSIGASNPRVVQARPSMLRHASRRARALRIPRCAPADASADSSSVGDRPPAPKLPHVDGRRQFSDVPDGLSSGERLVTDDGVADFRRELDGELVLAPLTKGGNLPFRRLCVDSGCNVVEWSSRASS